MGKKYYCDYCGRSFPYGVEARNKHLNGYQHQKLRQLHYDQFKSAKEILEREYSKQKCKRFHSGLECTYGENCIHSHFTTVDFELLKENAMLEDYSEKTILPSQLGGTKEPSLEDWLIKRELKNQQTKTDHSENSKNLVFPQYFLSPLLHNIPNVPPSLIPPSPETLIKCDYSQWG